MKHKYLVSVFLFLLMFSNSLCQINVDSLKLLLPTLQGKQKIDVLNVLAYELKFNDQKNATTYAKQAKILSKSISYPEGEAKALLNIGIVHDIQGKSDSSELYFTSAFEFSKKNNLPYFEANAVNNLGMMNWNKGRFTNAIVFFYKALKLYEQQNNEKGISKATSNIGLIYQELSQWDKALEMNIKAFELRKKEGNADMLARSCNNIGISYKGLAKYDKAMVYYLKAVTYAKKAKSTGVLATIYSNMAVLSMLDDNPQKALKYELKSIELRKGKEKIGVMIALNNLGQIYFELGKYKKGIESGHEALSLRATLKNIGHVDKTYFNLGLNHLFLNHKDSAKFYFEKANNIKDSIYSEQHALELASLEAEYEKEKKEAQIEHLTNESKIKDLKLQQVKNSFIIFIISTLLIIISIIFIFMRIRYKQKVSVAEEKQKMQQNRFKAVIGAEENERKRIARELHDGLGQVLAAAKLNMSAIEDKVDTKLIKPVLNSMKLIDMAVVEVRGISHNLMPNTLISLGLVSAIKEQIHLINESGKIKVHSSFPDEKLALSETTSIALYRAMQEIINNCIKYSEAKNIWIKLVKNKGKYEISISDDGKGFDITLIEKSNGIGWGNIISRVDMINGKLEVQSNISAGTKTKIIFAA
ncbi:MAG: tetratricopeptide repeat protein [Chlorobi bacterium]|nr:tetratricopeptide repeat protein [Chlorobiota bacterium]